MAQSGVIINKMRIATTFLFLFLFAMLTRANAEDLPTEGTFQGVYHVNRAGVGKFSFFIVSKALKRQMAPYEGKYIEMEVLKARQPINPGPAIVDQIGKVRKFPDPPLALKLKPVARAADGGHTMDVFYSVENVGKKDITVNANALQIGVLSYSLPEGDGAEDDFYQAGYTRHQLSFGGRLQQQRNFISSQQPGARTHFHTGKVLLRPGETIRFVLQSLDIKPGHHELVALATYSPTRHESITIRASQSIDTPLPEQDEASSELLEAKTKVAHDDEWLVVEGRILSKSEEPVSLFTLSEQGQHFLPGLIQLYSESGNIMPARVDWPQPDGLWKRVRVGQDGLPFKFRVRLDDRFSREKVTRIGFWTLTEGGIEKLTLADELPMSQQRPLPPWGKRVRGCRLRIQMPRSSFTTDESIRLLFQAESDSKTADMVWVDDGNFRSHVVVMIDGSKARIGSTGISDGHVYIFPFQGEITLDSMDPIAPGRHTLQLIVQGDPGIYTNLRGEDFRKFEGSLRSNTVEFEVDDEEKKD